MKRVFGVDPGYAIVGYGAVESDGVRCRPLEYGAIVTKAGLPFPDRLEIIYRNLSALLEKWKPDALSVEKLYYYSNQTTVIYVAEARGVILLAARQAGVPVFEYTPPQVKMAVTGYGRAKKPQVQEMTRHLLCLKEIPKPDDTADALALAVCHCQAAGSALRRSLLHQGG